AARMGGFAALCLDINGAGKRQRRGALPRELLFQREVTERAGIDPLDPAALRQRQQIVARDIARAAPMIEIFPLAVDTARPVAKKRAAGENPAGLPGMPLDPAREPVADAVVGVDRHDVRGAEFARGGEAGGDLENLIAIEAGLIVEVG